MCSSPRHINGSLTWNVSRMHPAYSRVTTKGSRASLARVKETFDVELWEDRKVKDTPHGFFAKMMGREASKVSKVYHNIAKLCA